MSTQLTCHPILNRLQQAKNDLFNLYTSNTKLHTELLSNDKEKVSPSGKNNVRRDWSVSHDEKSFSTLATKNSGIITSPFD